MLKRIANPDSTLMRIANPHELVTVIPRSDAESSTQARNGPVVYTGCRILVRHDGYRPPGSNPHERAATFSAADLFSGIGRLRRAVAEGYVLTCVNI